jgi:lipopolysaccharide export LptBFGC system permease protein LptF
MRTLQAGRIKRLTGIVVALVIYLSGMGIAPAAQSYQQQSVNNNQLDNAVNRIQQQTGGRVLRVQESNSSYVIKVLMPSGVIKTYRVKANQGQGSEQTRSRQDDRQQRNKKSFKERR